MRDFAVPYNLASHPYIVNILFSRHVHSKSPQLFFGAGGGARREVSWMNVIPQSWARYARGGVCTKSVTSWGVEPSTLKFHQSNQIRHWATSQFSNLSVRCHYVPRAHHTSPARHGRGGGVWGVCTPPRTFIPPAKTGWGEYSNFFHVVKHFSEKPATFFSFCSPQANFLGVGAGYIPLGSEREPSPVNQLIIRQYDWYSITVAN